MTPNISKSFYRNYLSYWIISLIIIGYPLTALIGSITNTDNRTSSISFRLIVISLVCIIILLSTKKTLATRLYKPILLFYSLYLVRILYDLSYGNNIFAYAALEYFIVTVVLPSVGAWLSIDENFQGEKLAKLLLMLGCLFLLGYALASQSGYLVNLTQTDDEQRLGLTALNPISLAQSASIITIVSVHLLINNPTKILKIISLLALLFAIPILIQAASRGPIVSLIVVFVWLIFSKFKQIIYIIPLLATLYLFIDFDSYAINRVTELFKGVDNFDQTAMERLDLQASALRDLVENPLFGKHFLDPSWGTLGNYPHNLFIESGMALGFSGLFIFIFLVFKSLKKITTTAKNQYNLIALLFMYFLFSSLFSGSIWASDKLFMLIGILLRPSSSIQNISYKKR